MSPVTQPYLPPVKAGHNLQAMPQKLMGVSPLHRPSWRLQTYTCIGSWAASDL